METVSAKLNKYRHSPRKVRLVADAIRGKRVEEALTTLQFLTKKATDPISKLVRSALASAKQKNLTASDLIVKEIRVDGGAILYRRRSASRGRAPIIRKRTSNIVVELAVAIPKQATKLKKKESKTKV